MIKSSGVFTKVQLVGSLGQDWCGIQNGSTLDVMAGSLIKATIIDIL